MASPTYKLYEFHPKMKNLKSERFWPYLQMTFINELQQTFKDNLSMYFIYLIYKYNLKKLFKTVNIKY